MTVTQHRLGSAFLALHERPGAFIIPNPFDIGSAKLLENAGFDALATSSAGFAFSRGQEDHAMSRSAVFSHLEAIVAATGLPVSADLGNGHGDEPKDVAETLRLAAGTGIVGASIEDSSGIIERPLYDLQAAADRIRAAAEVARALPFPFLLTARAENFLVGDRDLGDAIQRLQAYQEAGADVLYAPGLTSAQDISALVRSVDRPVNVLAGIPGLTLDRSQLESLGVKRISVGSAVARSAYAAVLFAAREMLDRRAFTFGESALGFGLLNRLFRNPSELQRR